VSGEIELVKNGLSNVLYWGFAQVGYRDKRVSIFRIKFPRDNCMTLPSCFPILMVMDFKK